MTETSVFDEQETQRPESREQALFADFPDRLRQCSERCTGLAEHLADADTSTANDRASLQHLPVLRKSMLMKAQQDNPPFGGFVAETALAGGRVFMSPGPVWEPQLPGIDPWQGARALYAAGIRSGDRVHNAFSYHLTPGGFILDEGARALGCVVFPAGVGNTESQVSAMRQLQASVYTGTPDYLQTLLDHARDDGGPLNNLKRALVSGGALFPAMREKYQAQGIHIQQCYATADLGVIAFETATDDVVHPGMVINENLIVEILVPGTGTPVAMGDVGEMVITRLHPDYPLLRFATGDLTAQIQEPSPCGRTGMRIKGWMGRADQRAKVRGMFVDPLQLAPLANAHPQVDRWRLVVFRETDRDDMKLLVTTSKSIAKDSEPHQPGHADHQQWLSQVAQTLKTFTNLNGSVEVVEELPNDGIVVEDQRDYENG